MLETLSLWLHSTMTGKVLLTALISMLPVVELRGGLPAGVALGLPIPLSFAASLLGNMLPVPFVILFARPVFQWVRAHIPALGSFVTKLETRAYAKSKNVKKYEAWGLLIFVAIPLPGTGAWTGALIASVLNMRLKRAVPVIFLGVIIAGSIMTVLTYGVSVLL
ncbi:MAG: small multi-drug export protein [Oscillospiraceae bacterium]|nr:small multi-drug export protein [Christensenella sp.]MDD5807884.1 small multi-drug export protein [Oscillospiraceae bacterium]MDD5964278.1 small multi-drug export protein [Oscillospiraceae bacterium]MDY6020665.1 small multi-drug export protein [Oscillospiraceae bacterium]